MLDNRTINDTNYEGFPLNNYGGENSYQFVTVEECQFLCEISEMCQYFNYALKNGKFEKTCFLKYGMGMKVTVEGSFGHKYSPGEDLYFHCKFCFFSIYTFLLADCTLGKWTAWGDCIPSDGVCGNGTRLRCKEELLPSRNGGGCLNDPESERCIKDCLRTGYF